MRRWGLAISVALTTLTLLAAAACTSSDGNAVPDPTSAGGVATSQPNTSGTPETSTFTTPTTGTEATASPPVAEFHSRSAFRTLSHLSIDIGPREATSNAYAKAAAYVEDRLRAYGYLVTRQRLQVPAGNSWGIEVPAGTTWNLIANPPGFDAAEPHRVVSAHLDTVPQAPGAEDDGSGIGVLLELARMAVAEPPPIPVVFIAFAAEEPRGDGDDLHHFGSTAYLDHLNPAERRLITGMASMDRVGVAARAVPVCTGGLGSREVQRALVRAGDRAGVRTDRCDNTGSDHWTFEKAGIPAARVGGVSYAGYHSAGDLPRVVSRAQLARSAAVLWQWITG